MINKLFQIIVKYNIPFFDDYRKFLNIYDNLHKSVYAEMKELGTENPNSVQKFECFPVEQFFLVVTDDEILAGKIETILKDAITSNGADLVE